VFEEIKQELDSGDLFEAAFKEMDECDILDKLSSDDILQYIRRSMTGDQLLDLARDILDDHKVDTTAVDAARVIEKI
jgi:hypothetical protein